MDRLLEIVRSLKAEGVAVIYVSHKLEEVFVVGYNGDTIALEAMKAGDMAGTVQQVPYEMGKMTVALALKLVAGQKLTFDNATAREIYVPVNLLTPADVK